MNRRRRRQRRRHGALAASCCFITGRFEQIRMGRLQQRQHSHHRHALGLRIGEDS
jgi:hypothetical protein